jgi:hypothetical protein
MDSQEETATRRAEALQLMQRKFAIQNRIEIMRVIRRYVIDRAHRMGIRRFFE